MTVDSEDWISKFRWEISSAERARLEGNEGRARVCARRAAGAVLKEFYRRQGLDPVGSSAYDRLIFLSTYSGVSQGVQEAARHFTVRITPDHELPIEADLIAEARWLAGELLGES